MRRRASRRPASASVSTASRRNVAQVLKTFHTAHGGKLSLAQVLSGKLSDGRSSMAPAARKPARCRRVPADGPGAGKVASDRPGHRGAGQAREDPDRRDGVEAKGETRQLVRSVPPEPVYGFAISVADRKDEVKLTGAIAKLVEEDPSLRLDHNQETHEMVLWGQGEMHLRVALERLAGKFGVNARSKPRHVAYKETIRRSVQVRGRHKKQSGGHGQFGDVVVEISPRARGEGFIFTDSITGGVVPKQYIPAVEAGVREYLHHGPLGFPVIDVQVNLSDGSYHSVDSSEMAFKTAARLAMTEGMPQCQPVLLEPIVHVDLHVPTKATPRVNQIVSGRRGQLLGFDARDGWPGWDTIEANMPEAESAL